VLRTPQDSNFTVEQSAIRLIVRIVELNYFGEIMGLYDRDYTQQYPNRGFRMNGSQSHHASQV
jgi:hypothetical protein